jgi:hypothetical protein
MVLNLYDSDPDALIRIWSGFGSSKFVSEQIIELLFFLKVYGGLKTFLVAWMFITYVRRKNMTAIESEKNTFYQRYTSVRSRNKTSIEN